MNDEYKTIAPYYDPATAWFMSTVRAGIVRRLLEPEGAPASCAPLAAPRVLDIGCGTGRQLIPLLAAGLNCAGVDNSPHMLAIARKSLGRPTIKTAKNASNITNVASCKLVQASAARLPFAGNSFDAALLSLVLHESQDEPLEILREAIRVAPRLLLLDWKMPERNLDYLAYPAVNMIERLAGRGHYRRFRNFMKGGGLEGLVYRFCLEAEKKEPFRVRVAGRILLRFGTMLLLDLRRENAGFRACTPAGDPEAFLP